jgi:hypothetical protein
VRVVEIASPNRQHRVRHVVRRRRDVLLGVVQVTGAPYGSQGRAYAAASAAIPTMTVLPNCLAFQQLSPTDTAFVEVPFHYGAPIVARAAAGVADTLDCSDPHVISVAETVNLITTVAQYNGIIQQSATDRHWLFVDPNLLLRTLAATPGAIRPFPAFPPDPNATAAPFGTAISRDGIHPSTSTQKLIAQSLQQAINAFYSSAIPAVP